MTMTLFSGKISSRLMTCVFVLAIANSVGIFLNIGMGHDTVYGFVPYFDLNTESNIPTLFSSLLFILAATIVLYIVLLLKQDNKPYRYWAGLIFILIFLSIDETAQIHESFTLPVRRLLNTSGILFYAWVIPYSVLLLLLGAIYSRFIWSLPVTTRRLFIFSAVLFLSGALGFELMGSYYDDHYGNHNYVFSLLYTCEEILEMSGVILFIYALLSWIENNYGVIEISSRK